MTAPEWMTAATAKPSPDARAERIRARAEQSRLDREAALEQQRGQMALERQKRATKMQDRQERQHAKTIRRQKRVKAINKALPVIGRRVMIAGPITAPMTVAWIGQIRYALDVLGWMFVGAVIFAAAWELTTAFIGWMYHQAREAGDRGTQFRVATWVSAGGAGAMNYWHALGGQSITHPTPAAVSYGVMSLSGIGVWELYASLIHRKQLRGRDLVPSARPRFGIARWARYPRITWTAWSLSIHDGLTTVEAAWSAAVAKRREKTTGPDGRRAPAVPVAVVTGAGYWVSKTTFTRPVVTTPWGGLSTTVTAPVDHPIGLPANVVDRAPATTPNDRSSTVPDDHPEPVAETASNNRPAPARKTSRKTSKGRPTAEENDRAVDAYRASVAAKRPLSERALAEEFGRSKGWARDRIQEAGPLLVGGHRNDRPAESANDQADDVTTTETTIKESTG